MTDISNEHQNSQNRTKLIYDYYGKGDQTTPLSYNILMTPSALNDYHPVTLTDAKGRVILDRKYANAARAAGIPQEGINGLPSDVMRNKFMDEMCNQSLITVPQRDAYKEVPYYQLAGVGGKGVMTEVIDTVDFNGLIEALDSKANSKYDTNALRGGNDPGSSITNKQVNVSGLSFSLTDLLTGKVDINVVFKSNKSEQNTSGDNPVADAENLLVAKMKNESSGFIEWMVKEFGAALDTGSPVAQNALSYARMKLEEILSAPGPRGSTTYGGNVGSSNNKTYDNAKSETSNKIGITGYRNCTNVIDMFTGGRYGFAGVNLNNLAQTFLTYFAQFSNGLGSEGNYANITTGTTAGKEFSKGRTKQPYTVFVGRQYSEETAKIAAFYDMIFNQLCTKGWTENAQIIDNQYLQNTLQGNAAFVSRLKDDGMYYQGNYSTDTYIKEIADDAAISKAEAKYNSEKAKINQKEQIIDLKMKNLDTEISALNTEYDTIKSTISKNIEKSFKRYSA
ncbi:MAG: hypothetical protein LBK53_03040 [Heliobacteriaceae bacterium]|nr:hypothetical protein [Heliobacteriaceae bacterium]